jgi:hypothetical protein
MVTRTATSVGDVSVLTPELSFVTSLNQRTG